jgi:Fic family protein
MAIIRLQLSYWQHFNQVTFSDRQQKVLNVLLDAGRGNFQGGLTARKYSSIAKVSRATAFREISDALEKEVLVQNSAKGRSVSYDLNWQ